VVSGAEAAGFAALAINPLGGLMIAIPVAMLKFHWSPWPVLAAGIPLAYVQVVAVDGLWFLLEKWPAFLRFLERRQSPRLSRLVKSRGAFWSTVVVAPLAGPWLVMALMRFAGVKQRTVGPPIFLGLVWNGSAIAAGCALLPQLFARFVK